MSQPDGAPQAASQYPPDMIRPERIANIPMLSAELKVTYTAGLTKLWTALEANPRGSETHTKATAKIKEVSREIMRHITNWKANNQNQQQQQRPQPQAQVSQQQLPNQQQQQPQNQQLPQQPQPAQQQPAAQQITNQQPQQHSQQQQQQAHHPQQPQQIPTQQQQQIPQGQGSFPLGQQAKAFLNGFKVFPPTTVIPNTPDYENYKRRVMGTLTRLVTMQESSVSRFQQNHEKISQLESAGQTATPDLVAARDSARMGVQDAKTKIDGVRNENEKNRLAWAEKSNKSQQQNNSQTPMPQQPVASPYNQSAQVNNNQAMSPAVPNPYQQQQQQQQQSNVPMHPQQQQQQQQQQQPIARPPNQQQPYQSPAPQGQPQPLSHAAAINQAQRNYSEQQGQGTPTPQSAGQPFNHTQNAALNVGNPKFPIPKNLPNSGPHNPVPLGPARPTFGGPSNGAPGMMGQPAVQKTPHFILEGEGDRVLSKKKLDELVRQVTGGGEGDGLTPDVEESVLTLADDFVDSIITAACRLAKIRPNSTLDIRDIQIILERNYNIRVPGYSLDEVRTVRKFQPAPGWTQKMNAVQAAKVMGKNDA